VSISTSLATPEISFGIGGELNANNSQDGPEMIPIWGTFVNGGTATLFRLQWALDGGGIGVETTTVQMNSSLVAHRISN
jgi:hypothetical protein